jgi:hypothetical protein
MYHLEANVKEAILQWTDRLGDHWCRAIRTGKNDSSMHTGYYLAGILATKMQEFYHRIKTVTIYINSLCRAYSNSIEDGFFVIFAH